jgi:hypothetical protein
MMNIDPVLLEAIKKSQPEGNDEGNLLVVVDDDTTRIQTEFLQKHLTQINPEIIFETGTNIACFSGFVKSFLPDINIITFGRDEFSADCVKVVEEFYGEKFIEFIHGNSVETMPLYVDAFQEHKDKNTAAWVDGGHTLNVAYSDLVHCHKYGVEHIFVDDINPKWPWQTIVPLYNFLVDYPYELVDISHDRRSIAYIRRSKTRVGLKTEEEKRLKNTD